MTEQWFIVPASARWLNRTQEVARGRLRPLDEGVMNVRKEAESQTARVLWILSALAKVPQASVRELSTETGIPVSSVYRLLDHLVFSGFVHKTSSGHYGAGAAAVQLAERYWDSSLDSGTVTPYLRQLAQDTGELAAFIVAHGAESVCVESIDSSQLLRCSYTVGTTQPLTLGASATMLLAYMSAEQRAAVLDFHEVDDATRQYVNSACATARASGYAVSLSQVEEGVWTVSAPVTDIDGDVQGVVSLMAPAHRSLERQAELIQQTCKTALSLSGGIK